MNQKRNSRHNFSVKYILHLCLKMTCCQLVYGSYIGWINITKEVIIKWLALQNEAHLIAEGGHSEGSLCSLSISQWNVIHLSEDWRITKQKG